MKTQVILALAGLTFSLQALADKVSVVVKEKGSHKYSSFQIEPSQIQAIKSNGLYSVVELDPWISITDKFRPVESFSEESQISSDELSVSTQTQSEPNDPEYKWMYYWKGRNQFAGSSEINAAVNKSKRNKKLRVAVIDGGFYDHPDISWTDGYSFFEDWGDIPGPEFRSVNDPDNCETGHGLAVASIIGAKRDNNIGIAGILDAEIVPVRAFKCNLAKFSVVAKAIRYASGEKVDNAPTIQKVDMINISMGGEGYTTCPEVLQDAINYANSKGVMIFVAAGNQSQSTQDISPAQCDGVVVTGASDQQALKWKHSNFGSDVDFMAAGYDVLSYSNKGIVGWWEGTSFASPNALGIAGLGLQHNPEMNQETLVNLLKTTTSAMSTNLTSADQDCSGDRCGAGLLNASNFMDLVIASSGKNGFVLQHALTDENTCTQQLYLSDLGNAKRLCQLYEAIINPSGEPFSNNIHIVRVKKGQPLTSANSSLVLETKESSVLLEDVDINQYDYGVKFCNTDSCETVPMFALDASKAIKPAICIN